MALSTNPVDWTVDRLLSVLQAIDTRTADAIEQRYAARDQWQRLVHEAAQIADPRVRATVQASLMDWRHRDLAHAQRLKDFDSKLYQAKQLVKAFLVRIGHGVPDYLGAVPAAVLIPVAIIVAVVGADVALALLERGNQVQRAGLTTVQRAMELKAKGLLTDVQYNATVKAASQTAQQQDPLGLTGAMQAALPLVLLGAVIYLAPLFLRKRSAT